MPHALCLQAGGILTSCDQKSWRSIHPLDRYCQLCSHIVNTDSQIGTVQDSYPALSCPVKSPLAALPAPAPPPNSFPFCTDPLSDLVDAFRFSLFEFRFSLFDFCVSSLTPLSTAFTPNL